jgi:hypothetical protein
VEKAERERNMKMRTVKLTPKFLIEALQGKTECFATNLPEDVQLLDLKFDLCSNRVFMVIRSDSFDDIAELYPIPEFKLAFAKASVQPTLSSKSEAKPAITIEPKPEPAAKTPAQPSQTASKMEREFTPEQRKLLAFKVENERVIVKPTQFLKAEWNDINEVVKSLGGKWVKGDILSYWEIPL